MKFKKFSTILSEMKDYTLTNTSKLNDFSPGSALRAMYEAVAIQIEEYNRLMRENMQEASEEGMFRSFGFERKEATRAYGNVVIRFQNSLVNGVIIPRGSKFTSNLSEYPQIYETLEEYIVPPGSTSAEVVVYCTQIGEFGNIPAETIVVMNSPVGNVREITNKEAFRTGSEEEPIEDLQDRFQKYIKAIGRSTNPAINYGVREVPNVAGVYISEKVGRIVVYAHDENGDLPDALIQDIDTTLVDYVAAGIDYDVRPVEKTLVDVDVTVTLTNKDRVTTAFRQRIEERIARYLDNMEVDDDFILSALTRRIGNIDKRLIYDVQIHEPTDKIDIAENQLIRPGNINVTLE